MSISTLTDKYSATKNFNFELISENQSFKEVSLNENFFLIDSLIMIKVQEYTNVIPVDASVGFSFIIKLGISGEMSDFVNYIAVLGENDNWFIIEPKENMKCILNDNTIGSYIGSSWKFNALGGSVDNVDLEAAIDISMLIDDSLIQSNNKTYSIDKILSIYNANKDLIESNEYKIDVVNAKCESIIDDSLSNSNVNTYSVNKIASMINECKNLLNTVIDDTLSQSSNKTYSIDKILSLISSSGSSDSGFSGNGFVVGDYKSSSISSNHNNWLICDGSEISRSLYSNLFNLIGTSFGLGDGSTTFNLPDFRGRVFGVIGQGIGLTNRGLGSSVGEEDHKLTIDEIPKHDHGIQPDVNHVWMKNIAGLGRSYGNGAVNYISKYKAEGGDQAHNNMQPTLFGGNIFILAR